MRSASTALGVAATTGLRSAAESTAVPLASGEGGSLTIPVTMSGPRGHNSEVIMLGVQAATSTVRLIVTVIIGGRVSEA
jgi:hypothetical protein